MPRALPVSIVDAILEKRRLLPGADTVEIARRVTAAIGWSGSSFYPGFKYFCGVCWGKIRDREGIER